MGLQPSPTLQHEYKMWTLKTTRRVQGTQKSRKKITIDKKKLHPPTRARGILGGSQPRDHPPQHPQPNPEHG